MTTCLFRSPLASRLQSFFHIRCLCGRNRKSEAKVLTYIDRFLMSELKPGETITYDLLNRWIKEMGYLSPGNPPILRTPATKNRKVWSVMEKESFCFGLAFTAMIM